MKRVATSALTAALAIAVLAPTGATAANSLAVHGSVNQVYVTGAQPGTSLRLIDRRGARLSPGPGREGLPGPRRRRLTLGQGRCDVRPRRAQGSLDLQPDASRGRLWLHV